MILYLVFLVAGVLIGALSCSALYSFQPVIIRYKAAQQAQERAQRAIAALARQIAV